MARPTPVSSPSAPATSPIDDGLEEDPAEHLSSGRADGAQQRDLAPPLRDQHVEGVPDDEGADQQGDPCEHQQHRGEDAHRISHGCGAVGGHLLTGHRFDAVGQHRGDPACAATSASTPSAAQHVDLVDQPVLAQHLLGGGQVEPGQGGAEDAVGLPEADDRRPA